jgi:hypothetical protein
MIGILVMAYLGLSLLAALLIWTTLVASKRGDEMQATKFRSSKQKVSFLHKERQWL